MSKTAALRKIDVKKSTTKAKATPAKSAKKPALKVVSSKKAPAKVKAVAQKTVKTVAKTKPQPVLKAVKKVEAKQAPVKMAAPAAKAARKEAPRASAKGEFRVGHHVVYPTHGVGKIVAEETQMIGTTQLSMLVIAFDKDRMTLRVPVHRAAAAGLRHVSSNDQMKKVFDTLKAKAKVARGMWSRRAQEYEAKINSGNVILIAEVVRDLHQNVDQAERSYSERMIYESALGRLVGELAACETLEHKDANDRVVKLLRAKVAA